MLKWCQHICILTILALSMFEKPSIWPDVVPFWVRKPLASLKANKQVTSFHNLFLPASYFLPAQGCNVIEIVCLLFLGFRTIHLASFQHKVDFWKDKKNAVAIALIVVSWRCTPRPLMILNIKNKPTAWFISWAWWTSSASPSGRVSHPSHLIYYPLFVGVVLSGLCLLLTSHKLARYRSSLQLTLNLITLMCWFNLTDASI